MSTSPPSPTCLILIAGHLATAPRPQKEAVSATTAGFSVRIRGIWWDPQLADEDLTLARDLGVEFQPIIDLRTKTATNLVFRTKQRLATELNRRFGITSPRSLGLGGPEMLSAAQKMNPALTMIHSEAGLWVGTQLLKRGLHVGVDFEDWFSEDLPEASRSGRPVKKIRKLERHLLKSADLRFATTSTMAKALADDSGCSRLPLVIPNAFPFPRTIPQQTRPFDNRRQNCVSFYWFSQTIGPGRGLEEVAMALPDLRGNWELHLRGNLRNYQPWFDEHFSSELQKHIHIHPCVPNTDLPFHTATHDVGLALESPNCRNSDLTASNKIFEYLRCGLYVIATPTEGQTEVMQPCPDAGVLLPNYDSKSLSQAMQHCIDHKDAVLRDRQACQEHTRRHWDWPSFQARQCAAFQSFIASHSKPN